MIICALIVFFPIAVATMVGFRSRGSKLVEMARSLCGRRGAQVLTTVEIPARCPSIFGGIRVGVTLAVVGAIVAEWAGARTRASASSSTSRGEACSTRR